MERVKVFHNGKRVWSAGHIRNNTFFGPFQGNIDIMASRILNIQEPAKQLQEKDNILNLCIETDEQIWLQVVPGALCKWDPTMEMIRGPDNEIYLRTTRDIMPREELRAWFSPSLKRELGIPKNDIDINMKGTGQQCPTCDIINQKSVFTTRSHLQCQTDKEKREKRQSKGEELFGSSSFSLTQSSSSLEQADSPSYELDSNLHHNLHSAFRRLASNNFPPFEDPQIASLISSFSEPRNLQKTTSETVADHHKNEFRKKFLGNEHYLKKHLYRESTSEETYELSKERRFLTSFSIQKPLKYEKLESNCSGENKMTGNGERRNAFHPRELDMMFGEANRLSRVERKSHHIWSPYFAFPKDLTLTSAPERRHTELTIASSLESFHQRKLKQKTQIEHNCGTDRQACVACPWSNKYEGSDVNQSIPEENSDKLNGSTEQNEEKKESENQITETRNIEFQNTVSSVSKVTKISSPSIESVSEQSAVPRYCFTATSPWLFSDPPFLSSVAHFHKRTTTVSMASLARYQHVNQFTIPYTLSSGPQSSPRASQGFTCDFCGKVYCRKYVLKIHMRTHTGFKPLKCKFCDKSFSDPSNMKKHVKLHDAENTVHKCKHCGRNFVRYRGLLNHIKSKHTEPLNIGMII